MWLVLSAIAHLLSPLNNFETGAVGGGIYMDWLYSLFYSGSDAHTFASNVPLFFQRWAMLMFIEREFATFHKKPVPLFALTGVRNVRIFPWHSDVTNFYGLCD